MSVAYPVAMSDHRIALTNTKEIVLQCHVVSTKVPLSSGMMAR